MSHRKHKSAFTRELIIAFSILAGLASSELGCTNDSVESKTEPETQASVRSTQRKVDSQNQTTSKSTTKKEQLSTTSLAESLFNLMEALDPETEAKHLKTREVFLKRPDALATLKKIYEDSYEREFGRPDRWKAVYVASHLYTEESIPFLLQAALKEDPAFTVEDLNSPDHRHEEILERQIKGDEVIRLSAESGLVRAYAKGVPGSKQAIMTLLKEAEENIASYGALNLFEDGNLNQEMKTILDKRGIFYKFRPMSEEEVLEYITIPPEDLIKRNIEDVDANPVGTTINLKVDFDGKRSNQ